ncbi:DUF3408 domain-containing protein [Bacteroides xylanisolvens]|jgi:hypothetical protein|uniref:DUF3408 domain-containing protein n=1 Tax=Bacteroides xylanisolvens TaxID=371601 RepID=UPI0021D214C2|nr:DUF3408 domain-containing protein [Bacteroides xylanisolvens]MCU4239583.1 DUF3408 domain-containing protein [Bacteroides xylanisolvens]
MKKQQADKPIDEELLMRMMAGETEKPQGNGDAPGTEEPEQETEKGETAVPANNVAIEKAPDGKRRKAKQAVDYDTTFLKGMDIPARYGKPVYVRREYHERIAKISMMLTGGKVSLSAYIDNVLAQHFEQYREEIEAAYAGKMEKLF